ncbi:MAG: hypothetical protein EOL86_09540, partial [Deltaproteobacteria bacterium]|nr:hypothetical protein [Deltaproteobacteria bacterium]
GFGFRTCDAEELEPMVEEATRATDLTRGPLAWAVLVPGRDETGDALALVIHHLIVDGVSWRVLQQDFTAALSCLDEGRPVELPSAALADDGSFPAWARRLAEYAHDPTVLDQAAFWRSVLAGRPGPLSSDALVAARRKTDLRECSVLLDAESTRNLLGPCRKTLGADMDALLLAGLVLAARDWRGAPGLTVDLEGHGRQELFPDVAPGAIVGWFTTVHPVALMARADLVATVNGVRQTLDAAPDKGLGFGVLKHVAGVELTDYTADVLFNYLGDASDAGGGPLALERIGFPSDVAPDYPQQAKLAVTSLIRDGRLDVTIEAHGQEFTAASLEGLLTALERRLREIAGYGRRGERQ